MALCVWAYLNLHAHGPPWILPLVWLRISCKLLLGNPNGRLFASGVRFVMRYGSEPLPWRRYGSDNANFVS